MSAILHLVTFADDGVITSTPPADMPGVKPDEKTGVILARGQGGPQRFACGKEQSKMWAKTDAQGVLHQATGEAWLVTCDACKRTPEYATAMGVSGAVPSVPPAPAPAQPEE